MRAQRDAARAQSYQIRAQMRGMRRGSVLSPILLIAIGVVFLLIQTGRLDHQLFWGLYGHWWPLLLVAAGVVLLAEWAFDQVHMRDPQRPPYRRSAGFGVFLMLFFLCLQASSDITSRPESDGTTEAGTSIRTRLTNSWATGTRATRRWISPSPPAARLP